MVSKPWPEGWMRHPGSALRAMAGTEAWGGAASREGVAAGGWSWGQFPSCTQQLGLFCNREMWFRCWGWIFIGSPLRLTVGNGWSWQRKPKPRSFLGQKPLGRVHPGSRLSNIIQKPQFTVLNIIQRWERSRSCSELSQTDAGKQGTEGYHASKKYLINNHSPKK